MIFQCRGATDRSGAVPGDKAIDGNIKKMNRESSISNWKLPCTISRSEEHTSELQSLMRISYDVFCLKKKITIHTNENHNNVKYNNRNKSDNNQDNNKTQT